MSDREIFKRIVQLKPEQARWILICCDVFILARWWEMRDEGKTLRLLKDSAVGVGATAWSDVFVDAIMANVGAAVALQ